MVSASLRRALLALLLISAAGLQAASITALRNDTDDCGILVSFAREAGDTQPGSRLTSWGWVSWGHLGIRAMPLPGMKPKTGCSIDTCSGGGLTGQTYCNFTNYICDGDRLQIGVFSIYSGSCNDGYGLLSSQNFTYQVPELKVELKPPPKVYTGIPNNLKVHAKQGKVVRTSQVAILAYATKVQKEDGTLQVLPVAVEVDVNNIPYNVREVKLKASVSGCGCKFKETPFMTVPVERDKGTTPLEIPEPTPVPTTCTAPDPG